MSVYAMAASSALTAAFADHQGVYDKAYDQVYRAEAKRANIRNRIHAAQRNIAALEQDKILGDAEIQMQRNAAQAMITVQAAAGGQQGSSIDDIKYNTDAQAAYATSKMTREAEQLQENELATIGSQTSAVLGVRENLDVYSNWDAVAAAVGSVTMQDFKTGSAIKDRLFDHGSQQKGISLDNSGAWANQFDFRTQGVTL